MRPFRNAWGDLRIEGYIQGKQVIVKRCSGKGIDQQFSVLPDDTKLVADGADSTRVVLRVADEFGAIRSFANDAIQLSVEGPAEIVGDNPFALVGGTGAVWLRAKEQAGRVTLTASHPTLGKRQADFEIAAAPSEAV
jgi:beta-galactosidase